MSFKLHDTYDEFIFFYRSYSSFITGNIDNSIKLYRCNPKHRGCVTKPYRNAEHCAVDIPSYLCASKPCSNAEHCAVDVPSNLFVSKPCSNAEHCAVDVPSYLWVSKPYSDNTEHCVYTPCSYSHAKRSF